MIDGFSSRTLQTHLACALPEGVNPTTYWVAFSGGCDSTVLLHALADLLETEQTIDVRCIHVNHGLSEDADDWAWHCHAVSKALGIACEIICVDVASNGGQSPEQAAREARYSAFSDRLVEGDVLLTAHHQDDQAETVLIQLFRGAGPAGLAAMPKAAKLGAGWLIRPLLAVPRDALETYAKQHSLGWVDDDSNTDTRYARNFIRHKIMPAIRERWPSVTHCIARSARHCGSTMDVMQRMGNEAVNVAAGSVEGTLSVSKLLAMRKEEAMLVMRNWIKNAGHPMPSEKRLSQIYQSVLNAREDADPKVTWAKVDVRRYRDDLYIMHHLQSHDTTWSASWDGVLELELPAHLGVLRCSQPLENGIYRVAFRCGGEQCRVRGHHWSLKKCFQEWGVPPWERDRVPLVYFDQELVMIPGVFSRISDVIDWVR